LLISLHDPMTSDCLFCKIIEKKIPAYVVREDEHTLAFLDVQPRTTGHVIVIPKEHAPTIVALSDNTVGPLFLAVKSVDEMLIWALQPDGVTIGINQGAASGQEVQHLHVHLMPRWHGDKGSAVQSLVHNAPEESLEEIRKKILGNNN
jgi:histidine triad (HIT) family protein